MDRITSQQRSKNMSAIRSSGTRIEVVMRDALKKNGYRFTQNDTRIFGKPDFVLRKYRLVIFCDSEFWHGKNWKKRKHDFKSNKAFWHKKIESNIKRDRAVNKRLKSEGWTVLRFWGNDILRSTEKCIGKVKLISSAK